MKKHFACAAFTYAVLAMIFGVFYREFTKFSGFAGQTTLSVVHTHYFLLGMVFCLMMLMLEKLFSFLPYGKGGKLLLLYHVGLNVTCLGLFLRGLAQVQGLALSSGLDASLSGVCGIGHALLGIGMLCMLWRVRGAVSAAEKQPERFQ